MSFRILSLDGGGSWSLIQIMTLIDLYRSGGALLTGHHVLRDFDLVVANSGGSMILGGLRSEEHTSELQSHLNLVCRLLLEKKKNTLCLHILAKKTKTKTTVI